MPIRESSNLVNQLTTPKGLYQTITQTLAQSLCGYRCVICTCSAPMFCYGVCVQGLHSTGHLQHPTQELAIRVASLTMAITCWAHTAPPVLPQQYTVSIQSWARLQLHTAPLPIISGEDNGKISSHNS